MDFEKRGTARRRSEFEAEGRFAAAGKPAEKTTVKQVKTERTVSPR